jgi:H+-translocating NAD(P) transhydrogenase subunit alpha
MRIGVPREIAEGETRVALVPAVVPALTKLEHTLAVERGAGQAASFTDDQYAQAGAEICDDLSELYGTADVIFKVQPLQTHPATGQHEAELLRPGSAYIGFLAPLANPDAIHTLARRRVTSFAMEYVPRLARAQSMDALSSMATVAGYKAVLLAANHIGKMFPLLMTAAGTVHPVTVLVLGAGVAGLQAIATARRLGAKVEAFDPRPSVREQVKSLGAAFVDMELTEDAETAGGYAKEMSPEFIAREQEVIGARLSRTDVVISTAQVFGKRAPLLITEEMVQQMRPGSVIVDLAAEQGGNCALTVPGQRVERHGVSIAGAVNLPATMPIVASQLYARNVANLFAHIFGRADAQLDLEDEITRQSLMTRDGEIVNASVRQALSEGA